MVKRRDNFGHNRITTRRRQSYGREKENCHNNVVTKKIDVSWAYRKFSKFEQIVRLFGWIIRFWHAKNPSSKRIDPTLKFRKLQQAQLNLLKCVQKESLKIDSLEQISSIIPFRDHNDVIRLKTKITERDDTENFRYPILLPGKHPVVGRVVFDTHQKYHAGVQTLLSYLRKSY